MIPAVVASIVGVKYAWDTIQGILKQVLPPTQSAKVISSLSPYDVAKLGADVAEDLWESGYSKGNETVNFFKGRLESAGVSPAGISEFNATIFKAYGNSKASAAHAADAAAKRAAESGGGGRPGGTLDVAGAEMPWWVLPLAGGAVVALFLAARKR